MVSEGEEQQESWRGAGGGEEKRERERDLTRQMIACKFAKENYCGSRYFYEDLVAHKGDKVSIAKSGKSLAMLKRQPEKKAYEYLTNIPKLRRTVLSSLFNLLIILA